MSYTPVGRLQEDQVQCCSGIRKQTSFKYFSVFKLLKSKSTLNAKQGHSKNRNNGYKKPSAHTHLHINTPEPTYVCSKMQKGIGKSLVPNGLSTNSMSITTTKKS
jgi:hypothetical protein